MQNRLQHAATGQIGQLIHFIRGQRVMLEQKRHEIGFHMKEEARKYRVRNGA